MTTKADKIRAYPNLPPGEVARLVGCDAYDVINLRWRDKNRDRFRKSFRDWQRRRNNSDPALWRVK